ncbi:two-component system response regulator YesN [Paenibacillus phyllosphaerae]|uniref:Two-component system response regulator YesN n=1 Tax=Paenibacillus phyllosphaerae TaxID=274593 RepID=A0A7W5FNS4_9BACL|nr:two-component system response regulator YesN [Paenibacillus phyllosphaerae]
MQRIRTLIVDDEPRIRRGIERLLLSCGDGFEIAAVLADGMEALEYMHRNAGAVDLVISDVKMPEMDGLTFVKEASSHYKFYSLFISGYDDFEYLRAALREGAVDYVLKPVDRDQFRQRMAEIEEKIASDRSRQFKLGELEQQALRLGRTRQTQALSYTTSQGVDLSRLGYWVDEFPKGRYQLMYVSLDALPVKSRAYTARDWEAYFYALENILEELVQLHAQQTDSSAWCWRGGQSDFWTLLHLPEVEADTDPSWTPLADRIRSAFRLYTPFSASIATGEAIEDLYLLPEAKRHCLSLIQYRLIEGGNRLFRPKRDTRGAAGPATEAYLPPAIDRLKLAVEQTRLDEALLQAKYVFEHLEKKESPAAILQAVMNLLILVHSVSLTGSGHSGFSVTLEESFDKLQRAAHLHELKQEVNTRIAEAVRGIEASRLGSKLRSPVDQAKAWIRGNLAGELTIKRIADQVHLNPTYFCECFKSQTGETVLDYVTRKRMESAKELLQNPGMKLQEISVQVGYQDVKYFSRLFKQWSGITPSQYRDQQAASASMQPDQI